MSASPVTDAAPTVELPLPEDPVADMLEEVVAPAAPSAGPLAAPMSAPLETSSFELALDSLVTAAMAASVEPAAYGASSGKPEDESFVTFSSLAMAVAILGLDSAQEEELAALGTLKFHFRRVGNDNIWTPITTQRSGTGSIVDPGMNVMTYVAAGDPYTMPRSNDLPLEVPVNGVLTPLTVDVLRSMTSEDQRALVYQHAWIDRGDIGYSWAGTDLAALNVYKEPGTNALRIWNFQEVANPAVSQIALTVILGEKGQAIIVDDLDVRSIAKLTAKEQQLVAGLPVFKASGGLGATLGLSVLPPGPLTDDLTNKSYSAPYPPEAWRVLLLNVSPLKESLAALDASKGHANGGSFGETQRNLFREMMNEIAKKLTTQVIYSKQALQDEASAILARFKTAWAYGFAGPGTSDYDNNVGTDGGATVSAGFALFMAQENKLHQIVQTRRTLLTGSSSAKKLDLPALIVQLQLLYTLEIEARIAVKSEEVKQLNVLLKDYSEMQKLVSVSAGANSDASIGHLGGQVTGPSGLTGDANQALRRLIGMFEAGNGLQPHPVERLRGMIDRPREDLYGHHPIFGYDQFHNLSTTRWSQFSQRLADTVTTLNQESQILMNDISTLEKEKNRFFEAGTNALARLNEAMLAITRAL